MKKLIWNVPRGGSGFKKRLLMTKLSLVLMFACSMTTMAGAYSQNTVNLNMRNVTLEEVIHSLKSQTGMGFFYNVDNAAIRDIRDIDIQVENTDLEDVLMIILKDTKLTWSIINDVVVIKNRHDSKQLPQQQLISISGSVKDKTGAPLPGVTVKVKNTSQGVSTDVNGKFKIIVGDKNDVLQISFVGMKTVEIPLAGKTEVNVVMTEDVTAMDEVVVTGIFERKSESFTGSVTTYKAKDLKMIGSQNVLQSLKTLDPSFHIIENNQYGSDPNRIPDIEIRGKTSVVGLKEQYQTDPNQPLFILDGFEVPLQTVMDLNMERVESVTLLKDAASTAIYGSRAANGVVVVETKKPEAGRLQVRYNGDFSVTMPDLTDYNMMNAREKLEFELKAGYYDIGTEAETLIGKKNLYNERKAIVESGVNTYWMSEPLRTAFTHKHNLGIEGGDDAMRYGLGVSYNGTSGVMKGSDRDVLNMNLDLIYRKGKFSFSNKFTFDYLENNNPSESFATYVQTNPYYRKNEDNEKSRYLDEKMIPGTTMLRVPNPLYNAGLNYLDGSQSMGVRDNVLLEYRILEELKLKGRISLNKSTQKSEQFESPFHTRFDSKIKTERGEYRKTTIDKWGYDGDITVTYGKLLAEKHLINGVAGWNFASSKNINDAYVAIGFPDDEIRNPAFSNSYPENGKPVYSEDLRRSTSFYVNLGYSYANRYQLDANYRKDGSSVFGVNRHFTDTWSAGLSWNMHNESFMGDWANLLKLRASIGNPGNQNFSSYHSFNTYIKNIDLQNLFGLGSSILEFGNPDLEWQKTKDYNIGADIAVLNNRLKLNVDFYKKDTDPLVVNITIPSSVGTGSFTTNLGAQQTKGVSGTISYSPIYKPEQSVNWTVSVNGRRQVSEYRNIGNKLENLNKELQKTGLKRYYDGGSASDLWAVRSGGIDPATGNEIFIKKDGTYTFTYDNADEMIVGNTEAKLEGVIGTNFYYKGFTASAYFRYRLKADVLNHALAKKVEEINQQTVFNNQDRRALYDRWQKPGDQARFRKLSIKSEDAASNPLTDRFVQCENTISGESFSIGYEFGKRDWIKKMYLNNLSVRANINDVFRASTIKSERGIDYPFARSVSFSLNMNF